MNDIVERKLQFVKNELALAGLEGTEFANSIVNFIKSMLLNSSCDVAIIEHNMMMVNRLLNDLPITPLNEKDFTPTDDGFNLLRTSRYGYAYKDVDGNWYDDRAVAYIRQGNKVYVYDGETSSKKKITLPYYPDEVVIK